MRVISDKMVRQLITEEAGTVTKDLVTGRFITQLEIIERIDGEIHSRKPATVVEGDMSELGDEVKANDPAAVKAAIETVNEDRIAAKEAEVLAAAEAAQAAQAAEEAVVEP